jgi:hypothetical protein
MPNFFDYVIRHHLFFAFAFGLAFSLSLNLNWTLLNLNPWFRFRFRFRKFPELNQWSSLGFSNMGPEPN